MLLLLSLIATLALIAGPVNIGGARFDIAALVYSSLVLLVSTQLLLFGGCAKLYARTNGLTRDTRASGFLTVMKLETLLAITLRPVPSRQETAVAIVAAGAGPSSN